jgi:hypothetical protein
MVESIANYDEQYDEIQACECIFLEQFQMIEERPYKFEIVINSNSENEDNNHLKLKILFELCDDYPNTTPITILKNLSPDIMHNNKMVEMEALIDEKKRENLGNPMIFDIVEALREKICDMNEFVLEKLLEIKEKAEAVSVKQHASVSLGLVDAPLTYTPVTAATFAIWCSGFMTGMKKKKEDAKTEKDFKLTGRTIFENKDIKLIEELNIAD